MFKRLAILILFFLCGSCEKKETQHLDRTQSPKTHIAVSPGKTNNRDPLEKVKLVMSLPSIDNKGSSKSIEVLGSRLKEKTGYEFEFIGPMSNSDILKAMQKDEVQIVFGDAWLYLASHHKADGILLAVSEEKGRSTKEAAWFTLADSTLSFEKLAKLRIVFSSPTDISGYLFPFASLVTEGIVKKGGDINERFSSVLYAGTSESIIQDLLAKRADAGPLLLEDFDALDVETQKKLKPIYSLEKIPNDCFFARSGTKLSVLHKVRDVLLEMSESKEGSALLSEVYGVSKLVKRSHGDHVSSIELAQSTVGHEYILDSSDDSKTKKVRPTKK